MKKIQTIFDRDWDGNRGVIDKLVVEFIFEEAMATEKLDGTNVRLTIRNHTLVRVEKRRNPSRTQKAADIINSWYVDAKEHDPADKYIFAAAENTDISGVIDGEWPGEAVGPKIQKNTLNLSEQTVFLFSIPKIAATLAFGGAPTTFEELRDWLPKQKSKFGNNAPIEGIVWHSVRGGSARLFSVFGDMVKIKIKDFK